MQGPTYDAIGFQQVTSTGTGDAHALTVPAGARAVLISVETTDARVTFDGSAPGATLGHVVKAGVNPVVLPVGGSGIAPSVKFASTAAAASIVNVTYLA